MGGGRFVPWDGRARTIITGRDTLVRRVLIVALDADKNCLFEWWRCRFVFDLIGSFYIYFFKHHLIQSMYYLRLLWYWKLVIFVPFECFEYLSYWINLKMVLDSCHINSLSEEILFDSSTFGNIILLIFLLSIYLKITDTDVTSRRIIRTGRWCWHGSLFAQLIKVAALHYSHTHTYLNTRFQGGHPSDENGLRFEIRALFTLRITAASRLFQHLKLIWAV